MTDLRAALLDALAHAEQPEPQPTDTPMALNDDDAITAAVRRALRLDTTEGA